MFLGVGEQSLPVIGAACRHVDSRTGVRGSHGDDLSISAGTVRRAEENDRALGLRCALTRRSMTGTLASQRALTAPVIRSDNYPKGMQEDLDMEEQELKLGSPSA